MGFRRHWDDAVGQRFMAMVMVLSAVMNKRKGRRNACERTIEGRGLLSE